VHPISPLIYGVAFGSAQDVKALNATANRIGGNNFTRYNWKNNTVNIDNDWYFESIPGSYYPGPSKTLAPGARVDSIVKDSKSAGAETLVSIPMLGWVAKVVDPNKTLSSFSVAKYGPQQKTDPNDTDAGNGVKPDGTNITGNDPNDADVPSDVEFQKGFVQHEIDKWGKASQGGVRYYIMDNEPGLWNGTHRDVHPQPMTQEEYLKDFLGYASMVKSLDPDAKVLGPEEWGWPAYFEDGAGNAYRASHGYTNDTPQRRARGGLDFLPWLLQEIRLHDQKTGVRTLDYFTVHIYPQGGDGNDDVSPKIDLLRNRDTRAFWDPTYVDEDWINNTIDLIPRLKKWVDTYYPGTKIGITEYDWGAEENINGATAQADILGIFGREGLDLATHWTTFPSDSPTFKAFQMYRNYDGKDSMFGSISVSDKPSSNPNDLSSFAAVRRSDGALTVMVINKSLDSSANLNINLSNFAASNSAQEWQLTSANKILHLDDVTVSNGAINQTVPAQSITLFVVPKK
jgi:hypothetical protein